MRQDNTSGRQSGAFTATTARAIFRGLRQATNPLTAPADTRACAKYAALNVNAASVDDFSARLVKGAALGAFYSPLNQL
jgi:hypothetical protein